MKNMFPSYLSFQGLKKKTTTPQHNSSNISVTSTSLIKIQVKPIFNVSFLNIDCTQKDISAFLYGMRSWPCHLYFENFRLSLFYI